MPSAVVHHPLGVVLHMLIDVVADHHIQRIFSLGQFPQLGQHPLQGLFVQPVIGVHHLVVHPLGVAQPLVDPFAVAAVGLVDGADDVGVALGVLVRDGCGVVHRAVVHQDDLHLVAAGQQGVCAVAHIGRGIIAGHRKSNQFHNCYTLQKSRYYASLACPILTHPPDK